MSLMFRGLASTARDLRNDLDDDNDGNMLSSAPLLALANAPTPCRAPAAVPARPAPRQGKKISAKAAAAKLRSSTLKLFNTTVTSARTASAQGQAALDQASNLYGSLEDALDDKSIDVLHHRLSCLHLLLDMEQTRSAGNKGQDILKLLNDDGFFHEQGWAMEHVHTVGYMNYMRNSMFDVQRDSEAVDILGQSHKDALSVLKIVSDSICKSATQWKANLAAEKKAKELEEKARVKEVERQRKAEERKQKAEQTKQRKLEEKAEKKRQEEAAKLAAQETTVENQPKRRRKTADLGECNYALLQLVVSNEWPKEFGFVIHESITDMANYIVDTDGNLPVIARCRRSTFKKVAEALELKKVSSSNMCSSLCFPVSKFCQATPHLPSDWTLGLPKKLSKELNQLGTEFTESRKTSTKPRLTRKTDCPAWVLSLDVLIGKAVEETPTTSLQILDRRQLVKKSWAQLKSYIGT